MTFSLLLFDADDTLFDFKRSERVAFERTLRGAGYQGQVQEVYLTYRKESEALWKKLENKEVTREEVRIERYVRTFETHSIDLCPQKISRQYLEILPTEVHLIDRAIEVLDHLAKTHKMGIITNAFSAPHRARMAKSGIDHHFEINMVSEECGFSKPDPRIFQHAIEQSGDHEKDEVLMIGDRLETDIQGAKNHGIRSCWFNPNGEVNPTEIEPDYEISSLDELLDLL